MADPEWLMGALAADDAYRGDWPDDQTPMGSVLGTGALVPPPRNPAAPPQGVVDMFVPNLSRSETYAPRSAELQPNAAGKVPTSDPFTTGAMSDLANMAGYAMPGPGGAAKAAAILGLGAGRRLAVPAEEAAAKIRSARQVGGGVSDPFPGSTGLERPQGNWMVRHNTGTPELVISGEGGHGFSSSKTGVPVEEARFDIRNPVSPENPKVFDIEELQRRKAAFILAGHDRLMGGGELVGAGGRTFKKPVPLEAGSNYPMVHEGKVLLPGDPEAAVLFANAQGPATKFNRVAEEARQQGYDPYLAGVLMNKTSGDSAKQMGRTVREALRVAPVGKDLAEKIDASIEGALGTVKGELALPFPGIKSREFGQWLDDIGGAHRAAAIKAIDQKRFVKEGAPDVGELRIANTNPLLLNTPVGSVGRLIGAMRPEAGTLNAGLHSTYGTTFFGNRGEIGGLPGAAPFHLMSPDVHRGLLAAGPAKQFANVPAYYATLEMPKSVSRIQPVTQEVVDNYLGFIRKHPGGWAVAGAVPTMGALAAADQYGERQ